MACLTPEGTYDAEHAEQLYNAEQARRLDIHVLEDGGFSRTLSAVDDLDELPGDRLGEIGVITIDIGGNGYLAPSAKIGLSRGKGLETRVTGFDRQWTAGLRHELQGELASKQKLRPRLLSGPITTGIVTGLCGGAAFVGVAGVLRHTAGESAAGAVSGGIVAALAVIGIFLFVDYRLPTMQLLKPGEKSTYERWRGYIIAGTVTLILGIAAALVAAIITHEPHKTASQTHATKTPPTKTTSSGS